MTTRTSRSTLLTRRNAIVAGVMGFVSFALGYLIHPMW